MSKHKWHSRLVNLAIACALVFSLAGIAVLPATSPVTAQAPAGCYAVLVANITAPADNSTIPSGQDFDLTFTIKNTGNCTASNVMGLVTLSAGAHVETQAEGIASLAVNATANFTAILHCDEVGYTVIHVDPVGHDTCLDKEIDEGCTTSSVIGIRQVFSLDCEATPNPTKHCHNVTFTATVGEEAVGPVEWEWDFGDGESDGAIDHDPTEPIVTTHHYSNNTTSPKVFHACVDVTDTSGITVQCCEDVEVYPALNVTCDVEPLETKVPHCLNFTAEREGGLPETEVTYTWHWDITDVDASEVVDTSGEEDFTWCPPSAGNYSGTVTLTDDLEPANTANCTTEIARVYPALNVTCDADPKLTKVPHCINFTAEREGGIPGLSYIWSWEIKDDDTDDIVGTSSNQTYNWCPPSGGNYTGYVTVADNFTPPNEASCNVSVEVYGGVNVTCDAEPDPAHVCHAVNFTAEVTGGWPGASYNWSWVFKNEDTSEVVGTSEEQNPSFTFMCVGNYSGFVTACDNLTPPNCANCTANVTVIIEPPELYEPGNGVTLPSGEEVCFEWEDIGCCNYTLQVWQKEYWGEKVWLVETGHDNTWCGPIMDGNYRWWVIATDMCGNNATSEVRYFGVQESNIDVHVTRPDGGETFVGGSTETITWDAAYVDRYSSSFGGSQLDLSIAISYSSDSGATWTEEASGEENDGVYAWSVPPINSDQCLVKVVATDDFTNLGVDTSDSVFTITTGVVVSIPDAAVSASSSVIVPININGVTDLAAVEIWLTYDNTVVEVTDVTAGDLGALTSFSIDNAGGVTKMNRLSGTGQTGDFVFANVELQAVGSAGDTSALDLDVKTLVDSDGVDIPHGVEDGVFTIVDLMEGDANLDGCVSIVDALFIAQKSLGLRTLDADQLICGDTFDDGAVDMLDALHIAQWRVDPDATLGVLLMGPLWDAVNDAGITVEPIAC